MIMEKENQILLLQEKLEELTSGIEQRKTEVNDATEAVEKAENLEIILNEKD